MLTRHYEELVEFLDNARSDVGNAEALARAYIDKGLSLRRMRWDYLWATFELLGSETHNWLNRVHIYANDNHIDTALRKYFEHKD